MDIVREAVDIPTPVGAMAAIAFRPDDGQRHPAVIAVHGSPGLSEGVLTMAQDIAEAGFVVLAPDMFYRTGRMRQVPIDGPAEARRQMQEGLTNDACVSDVRQVMVYLREQPQVLDGPVGITGFCFGGRVAYLAAVQVDGIGAAVMWYPTRIVAPDPDEPGSPAPIDLVSQTRAPILNFMPALDVTHCSPEVIAQTTEAFGRASVACEVIPVDGAGHGFVDPTSTKFDGEKRDACWPRMIGHFAEHLTPAGL